MPHQRHLNRCAKPLVSVIIPTRDRPALVTRAVRSALAQSYQNLEVIVAADGPEPRVVKAVQDIRDPRARVIELDAPAGLGPTHRAGVDAAAGKWIALLDDDDEWLPGKIERQMQIALASDLPHPIIATRIISRTAEGDLIWPRRLPRAQEPLCEYLFCQTTPLAGEGLILPSMILTTTQLLRTVRFRPDIKKHLDVDWLLRAEREAGVGIQFVPDPEPLAIWYFEEERKRLSTGVQWRASLAWAQESRSLLTRRAYASFILAWASQGAARARAWRVFFLFPWLAWRHGRPSLVDHLAYLSLWFLSPGLRRRITLWLPTPLKRALDRKVQFTRW